MWYIMGCLLVFILIPLQLVGVPRFYTWLGELHESHGRLYPAVQAYDRVLSVWPRFFDAEDVMFKRAVLLMSTEAVGSPRHADAEADLRALLVTQPENANVHFNLGVVLAELVDRGKRAVEAEPHLRKSLELTKDAAPEDCAHRREAYGKLLSSLGRHDEAKRELEHALELHPEKAGLRVSYASILYASGSLKRAIETYRMALDQSDSQSEAMEKDDAMSAYNNFAAALQEQGELTQARAMYEKAISLAPTSGHGKRAKVNLDKLPVSDSYRDGAARETRILAHRAAVAVLATSMAQSEGEKEVEAQPQASMRLWGGRLGLHASAQRDKADRPMGVQLYRSVRYLRRLETEQVNGADAQKMWQSRGLEMPGAMSASAPGSDSSFSLKAFAWGGVWYHSAWLAAYAAHRDGRAAIARAAASGKSAAVLGSSIGFEAYFIAFTYGLPTVGVELLCGLVDLSERVRLAHHVPSEQVRFECADALTWKLPADLEFVYVDDTAWDQPTIESVALRLGRELPKGALVIHNGGEEAYAKAKRFRKLKAIAAQTSWSEAHQILVHIVE